jgi:hypothetical protein
MKRLKNLWIIIISINVINLSFSQDLEKSISFAKEMFKNNNIDLALKEYLRVYYLDKENYYPEVSDNISDCFMMKNDMANAIKYQDLYFFKLKSNDPRRNKIRYKKQFLYLSEREYHKALVEILQVNKNLDFDNDKHQFLLSINYLLSNEFTKAKKELSKLSYYSTLDTTQINTALQKLLKNNERNPKTARWLSTIIPGLGQLVNGETKDGLNSLGLYIGFLAIWIDLTNDIGFGDASLSVGPWILRYYLGGLNNAVEAAKKKKHNNKQTQIATLINIIENGKIN